MSTRCAIDFCDGRSVEAKVYRHSDGYPDGKCGVIADLNRFFDEVESQTKDTRFNDPSYLAAKFIVWQAEQIVLSTKKWEKESPYAKKCGGNLDFLGVGVLMTNPGDIEYLYTVDCTTDGRPKVSYKTVR